MNHIVSFIDDSLTMSARISGVSINIAGRVIEDVVLPVEFDSNWETRFIFDSLSGDIPFGFKDEVEITGPVSNFAVKAFIVKREFSQETTKISAVPTISPAQLVFSSKPIHHAECIILRGPETIGRRIEFENSGTKVDIYPLMNSEPSKVRVGGSLESTPFAKMRLTGKLTSNNLVDKFFRASRVLNYALGAHCGCGNIIAFDRSGEPVSAAIGFGRKDLKKINLGWYDFELANELSELAKSLDLAEKDGNLSKALRQSQSFYRASNVIRADSIEMAIIASFASLEVIVNFVLTYRAGWTSKLLENRTVAFAEKLRASYAFAGVKSDPLEHLEALRALAKKKGKNKDAFEILANVRNDLVHQDNRIFSSGIELVEAWLLSQWLVEVFTFYMIGHSGRMYDRRIYSGWRGKSVKIPIAKQSNM